MNDYDLTEAERTRLQECVQNLETALRKGSYSFMAYWTMQINIVLKPHQGVEPKRAG